MQKEMTSNHEHSQSVLDQLTFWTFCTSSFVPIFGLILEYFELILFSIVSKQNNASNNVDPLDDFVHFYLIFDPFLTYFGLF